jgi:DNA-binding CsgD family transcriptional regulator
MHENSDSLFEDRISYEDLYRLLDGITMLDRITSHPNLTSHISKLISSVLPCEWGGVGIFERDTYATQISVCISQGGQPVGMWKNSAGASFWQELIGKWIGERQHLFVEGISLADNQPHFKNLAQNPVKNLLFDATIKDERRSGCFYFFANIDASLLIKYQTVMKLLLTYVYDAMIHLPVKSAVEQEEVVGLTEREQEIVSRIRAGLNNKSIARQLNISVNTVKSHVSNILQKLDAGNRVEALLKAQQAGYLNGSRFY